MPAWCHLTLHFCCPPSGWWRRRGGRGEARRTKPGPGPRRPVEPSGAAVVSLVASLSLGATTETSQVNEDNIDNINIILFSSLPISEYHLAGNWREKKDPWKQKPVSGVSVIKPQVLSGAKRGEHNNKGQQWKLDWFCIDLKHKINKKIYTSIDGCERSILMQIRKFWITSNILKNLVSTLTKTTNLKTENNNQIDLLADRVSQ